jgi:hypothetical protein
MIDIAMLLVALTVRAYAFVRVLFFPSLRMPMRQPNYLCSLRIRSARACVIQSGGAGDRVLLNAVKSADDGNLAFVMGHRLIMHADFFRTKSETQRQNQDWHSGSRLD